MSDRLQVSLERLVGSGAFTQSQLRLIEDEYHLLWQGEGSFTHIALLQPGDRIDRFEIDELLGWGGEAHVFKAHESESKRPAAVKVLHNTKTSERFRREMNLVQQLAHPNIVTAYEVGEIHGMPFIAMELMRGPDLNAMVGSEGPIGWQRSSHYILQIARALDHAHCRALIHRDIKPGNIIFDGDDQVKLVDLGLASMGIGLHDDETQSLHLTREAQIAGTLPYMAPEQARSLSRADARADIYSLGATWFYLLTGKSRVRGKTFSRQYKNLVTRRRFRSLPADCMHEDLVPIYEKMVAYDRGDRYQRCSDIAKDLSQALTKLGHVVATKRLSVLIVEDSRTDMLLAVELLKMANESVRIHKATSLCDGIKVHAEKAVDLVFLDLTLPDSTGSQTVREFRRQAADVPIVVLTGVNDDQTAQECVLAGATAFVSKANLTAHQLERAIFVTLSRHTRSVESDVDSGSVNLPR